MRIAVLGLGAMGSRIAANLVADGHHVRVWNRTPQAARELLERGAVWADSPRVAAAEADVVMSMVRDDDASRSVWTDQEQGAVQSLQREAIAIECSTITPAWARELARHLKRCGAALLDAPVLGSRAPATSRQLIFLVGGDADALERAMPLLTSLGSAVHHCGPTGSGAATKLVANGLLGIQIAAVSELLSAARKMGLEVRRTAALLSQTPVCSPAAKAACESIVSGAFDPAFPVELMLKDLRYLLEAFNAPSALITRTVESVFKRAVAEGLGQLHMTAISKLHEG